MKVQSCVRASGPGLSLPVTICFSSCFLHSPQWAGGRTAWSLWFLWNTVGKSVWGTNTTQAPPAVCALCGSCVCWVSIRNGVAKVHTYSTDYHRLIWLSDSKPQGVSYIPAHVHTRQTTTLSSYKHKKINRLSMYTDKYSFFLYISVYWNILSCNYCVWYKHREF